MSRLPLHMKLIRCWDAAMSYAPRLRWAGRTGVEEAHDGLDRCHSPFARHIVWFSWEM